jgi:hypothetical protein
MFTDDVVEAFLNSLVSRPDRIRYGYLGDHPTQVLHIRDQILSHEFLSQRATDWLAGDPDQKQYGSELAHRAEGYIVNSTPDKAWPPPA